MKISAKGLAIIEEFEGLRLKAYQDGAGVWTIGYGHTSGVACGQYETRDKAEADLCSDVAEAESAVSRLIRVPLTQNQFDALVSFTYNEGQGRLASSTLRSFIIRGLFLSAADEFLKWDIVDGSPSEGLLRRRRAERDLFLTPPSTSSYSGREGL